MPVEMRNLVAEAGEVYLSRFEHSAHGLFRCQHHLYEAIPIVLRQVAHLHHVGVENHSAVTGIVQRFHADNAAKFILPQNRPGI